MGSPGEEGERRGDARRVREKEEGRGEREKTKLIRV